MELSDFICLSIREIIDGIEKARELVGGAGVKVCPEHLVSTDTSRLMVFDDSQFAPRFGTPVNLVEFEVVVAETETSESARGLGVALSVLSGGVANKKGGENASNSKVKFSIPITYPGYNDK